MQLPTIPGMWGVLFVVFLGAGPTGSLSAQPTAPDSFRSALDRVDTLRARGRFRPALDRVNRLHRRSLNDVEVLWRRALVISDLGRRSDDEDSTVTLHRRALRVADAARAADSTNAWAHLVTALAAGRLTLHVGPSKRVRHSRAVKRHADRALALDSTLAPAYHLRGRWHRQVADLSFFTRALVRTLYGGLPDASLEQAVRDFEQATRLASTSYNHLELGKTYLAMERDTAARTQLERALTRAGSPFEAEHKREARALLDELDREGLD
jgi:tetratricopeptide (TPR) repeat protein